MFRKIALIIVASLFVFGMSKLSFAMMCASGKHQQTAQSGDEQKQEIAVTPEESVNVGNKICPVSGDKIDESTKATYEHEGKVYNFCCPACIEEFKKDPKKYIQKVEEETRQQESVDTAIQASPGVHEGHKH